MLMFNQKFFMKRFLTMGIVFCVFQLLISVVIGNQASAGEQVKPWKFAVVCDNRGDSRADNPYKSGLNESVVNAIAKDIVLEGAELVIVPGDMVNGSYNIKTSYADQFASWRKAMSPVYDAGIKVYPVRGNHEDGPFMNSKKYTWPPSNDNPIVAHNEELKAAFIQEYNDPWIPENGPEGEKHLTYSFSHKNAFFMGLDVFINPIKVNQPWIDEQLKENRLPHIFVYGHDPAFRVEHTDSLASYPQERDVFWNSIGKAGAKLYFCGHDHLYNRAHIKDELGNTVYQVLAGSGGAPGAKWSKSYAEGDKVVNDYQDDVHYGYAIVTVDGSLVTMEWKALFTENGEKVWDTMDILEYAIK